MSVTRVKVSREHLIERMMARETELLEAHEEWVRTYPERRKAAEAELAAGLRAAAAAVRDGTFDYSSDDFSVWQRYGPGPKARVSIELGVQGWPEKPPEEPQSRELDTLRRLLRIVEAAKDETISIAPDDDYAEYL